MKNIVLGCVVGLIGLSAAAETSEGRGPWHVTVGPAWRARVKMETSGVVATPTVSASSSLTHDSDPGSRSDWTASEVTETRPDPDGRSGDLWAVGASFTETTVTAGGGDAAMGATDERRPLGVKAKFGYDVWANDVLAVSLDLRFAGYWNMRSTCFGRSGNATETVRTGTDYWLFKSGPYPDDPEDGSDFDGFTPELDPGSRDYASGSETATTFGGTVARSRLTADLYQIGIGPSVAWHAFSWLDAYAGVAALCNIASLDFETASQSLSETQCRVGVAAEVGLVGYLTDNLGIYGEGGYEWIDGFDATVGGVNAEVDFSSLMVSAGIVIAF